jgi:hypothetical protein
MLARMATTLSIITATINVAIIGTQESIIAAIAINIIVITNKAENNILSIREKDGMDAKSVLKPSGTMTLANIFGPLYSTQSSLARA